MTEVDQTEPESEEPQQIQQEYTAKASSIDGVPSLNTSISSASLLEIEKSETKHQQSSWLLPLVLQVGVGYFYAYDTPSSLAPFLYAEYGITSTQLGMMYSTISIAILSLSFFGGMLFDQLGPKKLMLFATFTTTAGIAIFALATTYPVMLAGSLIFGIGSATMYVTCVTTIGGWFSGKNSKLKMTLWIGLLVFWTRLASFAAFNTLPLICEAAGLTVALWTSCMVCFVSFVSAVLFSILYKPPKPSLAQVIVTIQQQQQEKQLMDEPVFELKSSIRGKISKGWVSMKTFFRSVPITYWAILAVACLAISSLWSFTSFGTLLLTSHWGYSTEESARITSLVSVVNAVSAPIVGYIVGAVGKRGYVGLLGSLLLGVAYTLFAYTSVTPYVIFPAVGIAQSILDAVVMPSVAIVVPKEYLGKANGLVIFSYNLMLVILPSIIGALHDVGSYTNTMTVFTILGVSSVSASTFAKIFDWKFSQNLLDARN